MERQHQPATEGDRCVPCRRKNLILQLLNYIHYFFYLGIHWGWPLAFRLIFQEAAGEKKYGIRTTGADELDSLRRSGVDISNATIYMPVSYPLLEHALAQIPGPGQHFADIGCGKGRALCIAGVRGFKKVTGIDFSPDFCAAAVRNLELVKARIPGLQYAVLLENAAGWTIPDDTDCLFLFNPFDAGIMEKVVTHVCESLTRQPRKLYIIYVNPLCQDLFTRNGFRVIHHYRTGRQMELAIYSN